MTQQFITSDQKTIQTADNKIFIVQKDHKEENDMSKKFQFKILTGATEAECKARYDNEPLTEGHHDPYTFYLFDKGGIGYLGDTPLFGGDASKFNMITGNTAADALKPNNFYFVTADCTVTDSTSTGVAPDPGVHTAKAGSIWVTNASSIPQELSLSIFTTYMTNFIANQVIHSDNAVINNNYTGDDTTLMTSGATKALIDAVINNQSILQVSFFKKVELHTITSAEKKAGEITCFVDYPETGDSHTVRLTANDHENDIGLVFMCQAGEEYDETDNDGDECIFVNLHGLIEHYIGSDTNTTEVTIDKDLTADPSGHTKKVTVNVKESQKTATALETIIINAFNTVAAHNEDPTNNNDYDPTNATDALAQHRFITESQLVDILGHVLTHFVEVTYVDDGGNS